VRVVGREWRQRLFAWMLDGNGSPSCSLSLSSISLLALDAGEREPEPAPVRIGNGLKKLGAPRPPSRWMPCLFCI